MVIDFHVHSKHSFDCFLEPARIISLARKNGIDGLAVADHGTMAGVAEFRRLAPDLYIIAAEEVSTPQGDILGLFLKREIKSRGAAQGVIEEIRAQGGLAVLAHPFKWPHLACREETLRLFDCLEVFNARNNIPLPYLANCLGRRAVRRLDLAYIAGSDAHEGFELGRAKTRFAFGIEEASDERIKRAILEKRVAVEGREVFMPREIISHFSRSLRGCLTKKI